MPSWLRHPVEPWASQVGSADDEAGPEISEVGFSVGTESFLRIRSDGAAVAPTPRPHRWIGGHARSRADDRRDGFDVIYVQVTEIDELTRVAVHVRDAKEVETVRLLYDQNQFD
jgi:hypothetical protein